MTKLDLDPYYAELLKRFVCFAIDNKWYDSMASFYTPKQNLYRYITSDSYDIKRNRDRLGFHPGSISELDILLTVKGY